MAELSKLDQIRALAQATRARKNSRGGGESRPTRSKPTHLGTDESQGAGHHGPDGGCNRPTGSANRIAGVAYSPRETKLKVGLPKITEPRPWEAEGVSKRTWYRRQKEKK